MAIWRRPLDVIQKSLERPGSSEFLRTQQGVQQINEQEQRCHAADDIFHFRAPQKQGLEAVTGLGKGPASQKKQDRENDEQQISHTVLCNRLCGAYLPFT